MPRHYNVCYFPTVAQLTSELIDAHRWAKNSLDPEDLKEYEDDEPCLTVTLICDDFGWYLSTGDCQFITDFGLHSCTASLPLSYQYKYQFTNFARELINNAKDS